MLSNENIFSAGLWMDNCLSGVFTLNVTLQECYACWFSLLAATECNMKCEIASSQNVKQPAIIAAFLKGDLLK